MPSRPYLRLVEDEGNDRAIREVWARIDENEREYVQFHAMRRAGEKGCAKCLMRSLELLKQLKEAGGKL